MWKRRKCPTSFFQRKNKDLSQSIHLLTSPQVFGEKINTFYRKTFLQTKWKWDLVLLFLSWKYYWRTKITRSPEKFFLVKSDKKFWKTESQRFFFEEEILRVKISWLGKISKRKIFSKKKFSGPFRVQRLTLWRSRGKPHLVLKVSSLWSIE